MYVYIYIYIMLRLFILYYILVTHTHTFAAHANRLERGPPRRRICGFADGRVHSNTESCMFLVPSFFFA